MSNIRLSTPAAWGIARIFGPFACHHRKCNVLNSLCITAGLHERKFVRLIWTLSRVQSGNVVGPAPVSV
eukprot:787651-Lingulodinium_polyedra.AAC.1